MILDIYLGRDGLGTLSFGLSQWHSHNSSLVCAVALSPRPLHTQNREPVTIALQAHSHWWKKVELVQVHFTLCVRDQPSTWMQDGCKVYMDFYMASKWIMFCSHLDYLKKPPLGGRPNTKQRDHGIRNAYNHWFILFYHVWGPAWIDINWNNIWLRPRSHMISHYTWDFVTTLHDSRSALRRPWDTFLRALTILWSRLLACVWSGPHSILSCARNSKTFIETTFGWGTCHIWLHTT